MTTFEQLKAYISDWRAKLMRAPAVTDQDVFSFVAWSVAQQVLSSYTIVDLQQLILEGSPKVDTDYVENWLQQLADDRTIVVADDWQSTAVVYQIKELLGKFYGLTMENAHLL